MRIKQWIELERPDYIEGICQEATPSRDWPYQPDWIVEEIKYDTGDRIFWLSGKLASGEVFHWGHYLRSRLGWMVFDWRYDLTKTNYVTGRHETDNEALAREIEDRRERATSRTT